MKLHCALPRAAAVLLAAAAALAWARPAQAGETPGLASAREAVAKGRYADGLKALEALLEAEVAPETQLAARMLRVQALRETGRYQDAVAEAARAVELAPESPDALALRAETLLDVGRWAEAAKLLGRARKTDPEHLATRLLTLQLARTTGDREAAERQTQHFFRLYSQGKAQSAAALTAVGIAAQRDDPHGAWRAFGEAHKAEPKHLDAYLHAGFHCLRKFAWKYAVGEFQNALKLNPHSAVAHAGLAIVALRNAKFPQAEAAIAKALGINRRLPLALELKAALLTMEEQHEESLQQIQAVLAVNPRRLSALALLAAHHEALGQAEERDQVVARVLKLNPHYADVYTALARAGERRRQFPLAVQWARQAVELDPEDWEGYYLAGMNLLRIGEEREGYRLLERAFQLNRFNIWARNMLSVLDRDFKQKRFERFETEHFVVKLPQSQSAVLWPYVRTILEEAWDRFTRKYGITPVGPEEYGGKVLVLFFPDHEQFSARTVGLPGLGALGACFGQVITMPSPRIGRMRRSGPFNWRRVLEHEFCHVITLQKSRYHIPRWFTEGISVHEEQDPQIRWDALLARAVAHDELLPLETLNTGFSRPKTRHQVPVSYYQSALIVQYLEQTYGTDAVLKMCGLYAQGRQTPAVLTDVTGKPLEELNQATQAYIRQYARKIKATPPLSKKELAELDARVQKDPTDAAAWARLAVARFRRRKFGPARQAAAKAVALDPKLAPAHTVLGLLALQVDKKPAEAKAHFTRAREADPDHFASRLYLGLLAKKEGNKAEAIALLEEARRLYPRFHAPGKSPALLLADLYEETRRPEKAIAALQTHTAIHNNSFQAHTRLGDLLARQGRHAEAAAAYLGAIYIDPFDPEVHLAAAKTFEALGAYDRAATEYAVVVELERRHLAALVGRARCLAAAGKADEARRAIAAVREIDPANQDVVKIERQLRN